MRSHSSAHFQGGHCSSKPVTVLISTTCNGRNKFDEAVPPRNFWLQETCFICLVCHSESRHPVDSAREVSSFRISMQSLHPRDGPVACLPWHRALKDLLSWNRSVQVTNISLKVKLTAECKARIQTLSRRSSLFCAVINHHHCPYSVTRQKPVYPKA